jgi:hydrogenase nickel incorporation protein HypB
MCEECGCGEEEKHSHPHRHGADEHSHEHAHPHDHGHEHEHEHRTLTVRQAILEKNDRFAERNRGYFKAKGVAVVNLLSSPGSGKTALIERTLVDLNGRLSAAVIVGDLATDNDAQRIRGKGAPVVQITTGTVCHLEAERVSRAVEELKLDGVKLLVIENVGNLVCPASYDLGEDARVVLLSVTEGEDKPLKYPVIFKNAHAVIVTKIDLAQAAEFDRQKALANIHAVAPQAAVLELSSRTGEGMECWHRFLNEQVARKK